MSKKGKKFPKPVNKIDVNIKDVVKAHIPHTKRTIVGTVTKKVMRLERYDLNNPINDLITVITEDGKKEVFDRTYMVEMIKRNYPINPNYTNEFYSENMNNISVSKVGRDRYKAFSIESLIYYFGKKLYDKNPNFVPLTHVRLNWFYERKNGKIGNMQIPGLKYSYVNVRGRKFRVICVKGKKFEKWLQRNIFKISYTHYETVKMNILLNKQREKKYRDLIIGEL